MHLDGLTLMMSGSFVTMIAALLLVGAWYQVRTPALLWWAASSLANATAIALLGVGVATGTVPAVVVGVGAGTLTVVLVWAGVRSFNRRKQPWLWLAAGPLVWFVSGLVPFGNEMLSEAVGFSIWVAYLAAASFELWQKRGERLPARMPLIGFMCLHAAVFVGGIFDSLRGNMPAGVVPPLSSWFSLIHFESMIYAIGTTTFMVLLCKERIEQRSIEASRSDSLTGIANRGAFLHAAERLLRRCQADAVSFSLIMFDLDHFKWINDNFGHDVGDQVLRKFAETASSVLRPNDLFGRYGGEEFVVVLPGATVEAGYVIAERIRHRFVEAATTTNGEPTHVTVSAGVAAATSISTLDTVMRAADQSMYRAKRLGRNRVERIPLERGEGETDAVIRIA